ncbi:MAG TPA: 3'-5' exonuclease [Gammaproteobacteria bacterium]|nr:3'-5' exonuclease [Gammaproteobacteria bacterium]
MNTLVFDIETVPDVDLGRRIYDARELDDESVAKIMFFKQKQSRGNDFLPLPMHRVIVISAVLRTAEDLHVFSLGGDGADEKEILARFFDGLDRYVPELVSWNGCSFDLPVLHYRSLKHGVDASRYWELGDTDREFRFNNYLSRFHWRHLDLMDVLSGYQSSGRASLDLVAQLLGLPGKLGMSGGKVWECYRRGELAEIRNYCETDALNTYLVYLKFQLMRGLLDHERHAAELERVETKLEQSGEAHLEAFLDAWRAVRDGG